MAVGHQQSWFAKLSRPGCAHCSPFSAPVHWRSAQAPETPETRRPPAFVPAALAVEKVWVVTGEASFPVPSTGRVPALHQEGHGKEPGRGSQGQAAPALLSASRGTKWGAGGTPRSPQQRAMELPPYLPAER